MSRLGKLPIPVPRGVEVAITLPQVRVKGPRGEVVEVLPRGVTVAQQGDTITVVLTNPDDRNLRANWGLARQLVANAVRGVSQGYQKKLELVGIGFKAQFDGQELALSLGFSHPVRFRLPAGITAAVEKNTITLSGASKQQVGQVAAELRSLREPEPYKGKGIKYADEVIRRKAGKVVKAAGAK